MPGIVGREVFQPTEAAGQKTASERTVGDKADTEFPDGRQDFVFRVAALKRVFGLQRGERMHLVRAADGGWRGFGNADEPHLADSNEFSHRANGVFDGNIGISAVLVVEINVIRAEPFQ